jgi:hypothetical protein
VKGLYPPPVPVKYHVTLCVTVTSGEVRPDVRHLTVIGLTNPMDSMEEASAEANRLLAQMQGLERHRTYTQPKEPK